ncbi:hypothetical protein ACFQE8_20705 [Salinirubellus sp. GCM10025818]|jgi:hypothetical protein|uniref:DUF7548 family protein n=1 Tax=Salinirubellus TaxID=2162630 RepID=UPI0030D25AD6
MDRVDLPPTVGIVACLAVLLVLVWPFAQETATSVGLYYSTGAVTPYAAGLLALVAVIVFAAGRQGRSDPSLSAGAGLVFGLFIAVISVLWAFTARVDVLGGTSALLSSQRWVLATVSLAVPLAGLWYARALRLI